MHPGTRIRELRKRAKLTQGELGDAVGMSQEGISQAENDKRPTSLDQLRAIARALSCSVADLLTERDNPERLSDKERELLAAFRHSEEGAQEFLITSAHAVAERRGGYRAAG